VHYPVGSNSTQAAVQTGKTLWASEDSSTYFDSAGGGCLGRILNWNYVYGSMTSLSIWNLITSYSDHLFWWGDSLMGAAYPWSGSYELSSPLWAAAHTAQFAWPGWNYLPAQGVGVEPFATGGSGLLPGGGTYVTFVDTTGVGHEAEREGEKAERLCRSSSSSGSGGGDAAKAAVTEAECARRRVEAVRAVHEAHFRSGTAYTESPSSHSSASSSSSTSPPLHWSLVLETQSQAHSQCIRSNPPNSWSIAVEQNATFTLADGLVVPEFVIVWKSVFFTSLYEPSTFWFQRQEEVAVDTDTRSFTLTLHPDSLVTVTSMDRGQSHGEPATPPPANTPFPSSGGPAAPYTDDFQGYAADSMPRYFSDQTGSFAVLPRRDGADGLAYEQVVVADPVAWSGDSLFPITLVGDWNSSGQDVNASVYIYSEAAYAPSGDPTLSLVPCAAADPGQVWYFNVSGAVALQGSIVDAQLGACLDVFACATDPGTPIWMWGCVTTPGTNCASANQLWDFVPAAAGEVAGVGVQSTGSIVSRMTTGYCLTAIPPPPAASGGGAWSVVASACGNATLPEGSVQTFTYDSATGRLAASPQPSPSPLCLCSRPAANTPSDATHAGIGLRLGGMTASSSVAVAYSSTWLNYGYFLTVRPDGTWAILAGSGAPGELSEEEAEARRAKRRGGVDDVAGTASAVSSSPPSLRADPRRILANGTLPSLVGLQRWHALRFSANGSTLSAWVDGALVATVEDGAYPVGWAGLTTGWHIAQAGNFSYASW
jgi:hypothetical protein